jgi:cytochrome c-type biogenesis protein CcmH/NrfG
LYTEVEEMMKQMGKEQAVLITKQMQQQAIQDRRRQVRLKKLKQEFIIGVFIVLMIFVMGGMFMYVAYDRQQKYPQYGSGLFPKSEKQRQREAEPQIYVGR